jgi:DNA polymerase-3 subunit alpha/DNA polymerase-3 subunit epsilon
MRILILDTETTGLPLSRTPADKAPNNWPHLASIAWVILENNLIVKQRNFMVRPMGWTIPEEASKIHGITTEMAEKDGVSLSFIMNEFLAEKCEKMIAHNMNFDYNVIVNAIKWDLKRPFNGFSQSMGCTMTASKSKCNLPGRFGIKPPKLSELFNFIFHRYPPEDKLHSAIYDVLTLTQCIQSCSWLQAALGLPVTDVSRINEAI